jgi:hypothetical protein
MGLKVSLVATIYKNNAREDIRANVGEPPPARQAGNPANHPLSFPDLFSSYHVGVFCQKPTSSPGCLSSRKCILVTSLILCNLVIPTCIF